MTLAGRLLQQTGAAVLLIWGERLPGGRGYTVHVLPAPALSDEATPETAAATINGAMEQLIRLAPGQYLWGYHRYKKPRGQDIAAAAAKELA
jgi:KDO2-lipid IV(A) lauroyltransferase